MADAKNPSLSSLLESPWTEIRSDLILHKGPNTPYGERTWYLEDPISGHFYQLGFVEHEFFLRLLAVHNLEEAVRKLYQETGLRPSMETIVQFLKLLQREKLTTAAIQTGDQKCKPTIKPQEPSLWRRLLYGYVYFRIPLFRPDRLLTRTYPWVKKLWSTPARFFYAICAFLGVLLVLQQWDLYVHSFSHLFTPTGAILFFLCLSLTKIGHEFSHAYTAKSLGLHVRSMGVVLIVLWPILYTDTTDAWRLKDRQKRFKIDRAGLVFELVVAGISLLLWGLFPEGYVKSLLFYLSTSSLVSSLFVNFNPFMRFDGYYMLMDLWGIDNLQPRALDLVSYKIRRWLLDWQTPPPEYHPQETAMVLYGFGVMLYRVIIVIGIGLAVYHLFFQTLGIILLVVEIWVFILMPVVHEVQFIIKNKQHIGHRKKLLRTGGVVAALLLLLFIPLPSVEVVPGMVLNVNHTPILAPESGQLVASIVAQGTPVKKGTVLAKLADPKLEQEVHIAEFDLRLVEAKIFQLGSSGEEGGYRNWLLAEKSRLMAHLAKLNESKDQLTVKSPIDGVVTDINPDVYPEDWLKKATYLLTVALPKRHQVKAFVHEHDIERITAAGITGATLHCSDLETPVLEMQLVDQTPFPVSELPNDSLYDFAGGPIVAQQGQNSQAYPRNAHFPLLFSLEGAPFYLAHGTPCWVWVKGTQRSIAAKWTRAIGGWFTREGFFI